MKTGRVVRIRCNERKGGGVLLQRREENFCRKDLTDFGEDRASWSGRAARPVRRGKAVRQHSPTGEEQPESVDAGRYDIQNCPLYTDRFYCGQRRHLTASVTNELLAGRYDSVEKFEKLKQGPAQRTTMSPIGYTQIIHRSVFEKVRYSEEYEHFNTTDNLFVRECKRQRIFPKQLNGLVCLHLEHPRSWHGTETFL